MLGGLFVLALLGGSFADALEDDAELALDAEDGHGDELDVSTLCFGARTRKHLEPPLSSLGTGCDDVAERRELGGEVGDGDLASGVLSGHLRGRDLGQQVAVGTEGGQGVGGVAQLLDDQVPGVDQPSVSCDGKGEGRVFERVQLVDDHHL